MRGEYDVLSARSINELGHFEMKVSAAVRGEEETQPYRVGCYYYNEGNGLYIILGYSDTGAIRLVEELLESLAFSGIGGKRSSGLGRFGLHRGKLPSNVLTRLEGSGKRYMTLSVSLPTDNEMEDVLDNAEYLLCKRSGFVASEQYAMEQQRRRDLYVLQAGTCIGKRYNGDIYDVSDKGGKPSGIPVCKTHAYGGRRVKEHLKCYRVVLKTMAPVFIGSGREIGKKEYFF